jgi:hypothetical protein
MSYIPYSENKSRRFRTTFQDLLQGRLDGIYLAGRYSSLQAMVSHRPHGQEFMIQMRVLGFQSYYPLRNHHKG